MVDDHIDLLLIITSIQKSLDYYNYRVKGSQLQIVFYITL